MQVNLENQPTRKMKIKRPPTVQTAMNYIGLIIFFILLLTPFTTPLTISSSFEFFYDKENLLASKKYVEFSLFIFPCAIIYFLLLNTYFLGGKWRNVFFAILSILSFLSLYMAVYLFTTTQL